MSELKFRILGARDSTPQEWLRAWANLYQAKDDEYSSLIATARRQSLADEDFIRIGKWKDRAKTETRWKPNVASVAYLIWKQASKELPACPKDNEVEAFLNEWSKRTYIDKFPNGAAKKKRFGLSRATTLLHFISGGRFPILDSRTRGAIARLYDCPARNDVHWYLNVFWRRFSELAALCGTMDDLRRLDKALFSYDSFEKLIRKVHRFDLDWSQCPAVESVPGKVGGAWVLKGTRMPASTIFANIEAGANIDDVMEWFEGLDREKVRAVIEFASRGLEKPPAYAR